MLRTSHSRASNGNFLLTPVLTLGKYFSINSSNAGALTQVGGSPFSQEVPVTRK